MGLWDIFSSNRFDDFLKREDDDNLLGEDDDNLLGEDDDNLLDTNVDADKKAVEVMKEEHEVDDDDEKDFFEVRTGPEEDELKINPISSSEKSTKENAIAPISLNGKRLIKELHNAVIDEMKALKNDKTINVEKFSQELSKRFIKSINNATTGFGSETSIMEKAQKILDGLEKNSDDYMNLDKMLNDLEKAHKDRNKSKIAEINAKLLEEYPEELNQEDTQAVLNNTDQLERSILDATKKLAEELNKEKETADKFWNSTNSLTKANKERSMLNVFGHIYDYIGSVCHMVAVKFSSKNKNAADLFAEVGDLAQEYHDRLSENQQDRDKQNNRDASSLVKKLRKMMERDEDSLKEKVEAKDKETIDMILDEQNKILGEAYKTPAKLINAISLGQTTNTIDDHVNKQVLEAILDRELRLDKVKEITASLRDKNTIDKDDKAKLKELNIDLNGSVENVKENLTLYLEKNKISEQERGMLVKNATLVKDLREGRN